MATTLIERVESLRIGSVIFVSPNEIKVRLDAEAPDSMALNTGSPIRFPHVNSYLLIPSDCSYVVSQVVWAESHQVGGVNGDTTIVKLPYSSRVLSLSPIGVLTQSDDGYKFHRGADSLPAVGEDVHLPTVEQVRAIVMSGDNRRVWIGTSPLAEDARIAIDPDRLFGRHLAVLGNTGSGKSCSVAGIIRWVLEAAQKNLNVEAGSCNSRIIILDPNGEYSKCFASLGGDVDIEVLSASREPFLNIPYWMWTGSEWCAFAQASPRAQEPFLRRALRDVKSGLTGEDGNKRLQKSRIRRSLTTKLITIKSWVLEDYPQKEGTKFGYYLEAIQSDIVGWSNTDGLGEEIKITLEPINEALINATDSHRQSFRKGNEEVTYFRSFDVDAVTPIIAALENAISAIADDSVLTLSEDAPVAFNINTFIDHISGMAEVENASQFVDYMTLRLRALATDGRLMRVIEDRDIKLKDWLEGFLTTRKTKITIVDLSLVPSELIYIVSSVVARMTFDALQKYRAEKGCSLPTLLVMEEAHSFIRRYSLDDERMSTATVCCKVFEKIAREGRKFGLGLLLSSQRPSELSPTVLSQCNTFLLHRISNDKDQELVKRLLPDNVHGLMRDLPVLPSRYALLLGWASELPVLVHMRELPEEQRPQSADPEFWDVWTRKEERDVDWGSIADKWQGR